MRPHGTRMVVAVVLAGGHIQIGQNCLRVWYETRECDCLGIHKRVSHQVATGTLVRVGISPSAFSHRQALHAEVPAWQLGRGEGGGHGSASNTSYSEVTHS